MRVIWIVFIALVGVGFASRQSRAESSEFASCREGIDEGALFRTQLAACYEQELTREDKRLNTEYKRLQDFLSQNDPGAVRPLVAAQRQWLTYREAWCSYEEKRNAAPGSLVNRAICMTEFTTKQADLIHGQIP